MSDNTLNLNNLSQVAKEDFFNSIRRNLGSSSDFVEVAGDTMTGELVLSGGAKVGSSGNSFTQIILSTVTLSPATVAVNTTAEQTFFINGLTTGDFVSVNKPAAQAGLGIVGVRVSAASTLAITFANVTGAIIQPSVEAYKVFAIRF